MEAYLKAHYKKLISFLKGNQYSSIEIKEIERPSFNIGSVIDKLYESDGEKEVRLIPYEVNELLDYIQYTMWIMNPAEETHKNKLKELITMHQYHKYLGSVIKVESEEVPYNGRTIIQYKVIDESILDDISKVCEKNGHTMRYGIKDIFGTCDFDTNRLNVVIDKDSDGVFKIKKLNFG
jgi:hypothetical protein